MLLENIEKTLKDYGFEYVKTKSLSNSVYYTILNASGKNVIRVSDHNPEKSNDILINIPINSDEETAINQLRECLKNISKQENLAIYKNGLNNDVLKLYIRYGYTFRQAIKRVFKRREFEFKKFKGQHLKELYIDAKRVYESLYLNKNRK